MRGHTVDEYVWPEVNYTDKIHDTVHEILRRQPYLRFNKNQIKDLLVRELPWLTLDTEKRKSLASKLITTGLRKFEQAGLIKEVIDVTLHEKGWMWASGAKEQEKTFANITPEDEIAKNQQALKACLNRSLSRENIKKLNQNPP